MQPILHTSQGWLQPNSTGETKHVKVKKNKITRDRLQHQNAASKSTGLTQNHLWGSVVTCGDDGRVVLVVKGGAPKVNKPHGGVVYPLLVAFLEGRQMSSEMPWPFFLQLLLTRLIITVPNEDVRPR